MAIFSPLLTTFWLMLIAYWLVSARRKKKKAQGGPVWRGVFIRAGLVLGALLLLRLAKFHTIARDLHLGIVPLHPALRVLGLILCVSGMAFAIWARRHLGRNWGMPMSLQENHELITTGPYSLVRHPIYTGLLFAMLGSALVEGTVWLIPLIISGPYFIYGAAVEERLMMQQFPKDYPDYRARTKMLIPFVW